jgi:purine-binding chemotaxis protein CheW
VPDGGDSSNRRFVCARAGEHAVAFFIDEVQEVVVPKATTRLFHAPEEILGVINLRGEILPVVDLARVLGATTRGRVLDETRLVVLRAKLPAGLGARAAPFAVRVDGLEPLRDGVASPLPPGVPASAAAIAAGIVASPAPSALVVDAAKLIAIDALSTLRAM